MQNKDDKVGNQLLINKKGKGKKESKREIKDSQKNIRFAKKGPNFGFCTCVKNKKAV